MSVNWVPVVDEEMARERPEEGGNEKGRGWRWGIRGVKRQNTAHW